jgi:hypothetical protein
MAIIIRVISNKKILIINQILHACHIWQKNQAQITLRVNAKTQLKKTQLNRVIKPRPGVHAFAWFALNKNGDDDYFFMY